MSERAHIGFTQSAQLPEQQAALVAFEDLISSNPDLARQAIGVGEAALKVVDADRLTAAQSIVQGLLDTRADLELGIAGRYIDLTQNEEYASALWEWRLANWASKPNDARETAADERRRRIRLKILLDAALEPVEPNGHDTPLAA